MTITRTCQIVRARDELAKGRKSDQPRGWAAFDVLGRAHCLLDPSVLLKILNPLTSQLQLNGEIMM